MSPPGRGCDRWPEWLRLRSSATGGYVLGRCRATNLCDYCARIEAVVVSEMLGLDAIDSGCAPTVWCVLTTRTATTDTGRGSAFCRAIEHVTRAVRRRWRSAEYVGIVEFTTGYGPRSGGERRPHWNLLWKGIPASDVEELRAVVTRVWCSRIDAKPEGQFTGEVAEVGGLMRYLALHFLKESQRPPKGWRGHRVRASAGYFGIGRGQARAAAVEALKGKRAVHRAIASGLDGAEAEAAAALELMSREGETFTLVRVVERVGPLVVSAREMSRGAGARGALQWVKLDGERRLVNVESGEVWR